MHDQDQAGALRAQRDQLLAALQRLHQAIDENDRELIPELLAEQKVLMAEIAGGGA